MARFSLLSFFASRAFGKISASLEMPQPFGYKTGWLAIKSSDTDAVIKRLGLAKVRPAAWQDMYRLTAERRSAGQTVFVCPPLQG